MHRYRTHTCGALRDSRHRRDRAAVRLVPSHPRPRRRAVHRSARPLRPDAGAWPTRIQPGVQGRRDAARRMGGADRRQGAPAPGRHREPRTADRRGRGLHHARSRCWARPAELPMPVFGDQEYPEEIRLKYRFLDLRRERLHHNIMKRGADHRLDPPPHEGAGLLRIPDADPDRVVAGRRARLPRAVAHASGQVLRAAAGAAAVQAAHHDRGLRPLFPDRAVLPRRGRARRPLARRVLSARHRDELRHAGRRVRRGRAGDARRVRGIRRRQAGDAEVSAHSVSPRRCANTAPTSRTCAIRSRCRTSREAFRGSGFKVFASILAADPKDEVWAIPAPGGGNRAFCDRMNSWAQGEGQPGLGYIFWREGEEGGAGPLAKNIGPERTEADRAISSASKRRRRGVLRRRRAGELREVRRPGAHQGRRGARPHREGPLRVLLDRRLPDVRVERGGEEDRLLPQPVLDAEHASRRNSSRSIRSDKDKLLGLKAIQYDIVCNGIELSSGAIRNHRPDVMKKAFAIAGYPRGRAGSRSSAACCARSRSARRRTAASRPASTASSCCCAARRTCARWCCSR